MVNLAMLVGNLGRDPESKPLPSGGSVTTFSLATSRKFKDRDGNRKEETEWHNIVVYGKQAEIAAQYLTKGKTVCVEGRIQTRSWDDKDSGKKVYRTEIVCNQFAMLGGKGDSSSAKREPTSAHENGGDFQDDDIPFALFLAPLAAALIGFAA